MSFLRFIILALSSVAIISCNEGSGGNSKKDEAAVALAEYEDLKEELNSIGAPIRSWSEERLVSYEAKLSQLESLRYKLSSEYSEYIVFSREEATSYVNQGRIKISQVRSEKEQLALMSPEQRVVIEPELSEVPNRSGRVSVDANNDLLNSEQSVVEATELKIQTSEILGLMQKFTPYIQFPIEKPSKDWDSKSLTAYQVLAEETAARLEKIIDLINSSSAQQNVKDNLLVGLENLKEKVDLALESVNRVIEERDKEGKLDDFTAPMSELRYLLEVYAHNMKSESIQEDFNSLNDLENGLTDEALETYFLKTYEYDDLIKEDYEILLARKNQLSEEDYLKQINRIELELSQMMKLRGFLTKEFVDRGLELLDGQAEIVAELNAAENKKKVPSDEEVEKIDQEVATLAKDYNSHLTDEAIAAVEFMDPKRWSGESLNLNELTQQELEEYFKHANTLVNQVTTPLALIDNFIAKPGYSVELLYPQLKDSYDELTRYFDFAKKLITKAKVVFENNNWETPSSPADFNAVSSENKNSPEENNDSRESEDHNDGWEE